MRCGVFVWLLFVFVDNSVVSGLWLQLVGVVVCSEKAAVRVAAAPRRVLSWLLLQLVVIFVCSEKGAFGVVAAAGGDVCLF